MDASTEFCTCSTPLPAFVHFIHPTLSEHGDRLAALHTRTHARYADACYGEGEEGDTCGGYRTKTKLYKCSYDSCSRSLARRLRLSDTATKEGE